MPQKTLKISTEQFRAASFEVTGEEGKRDFFMSLSSEEPYLRESWDGDEYYEVLDHSPGGLDDSRLKAGLPILFNHKADMPLGNAKKFENAGGKLRVSDIVWSSSQFAQEKKKDAESGALPFTSVGYRITDSGKQVGERNGIPVIKFKWEIHEGSLAPVPADYTVGPMRNRADSKEESLIEVPITTKETVDTPQKSNTTRTNPMADPIAPAPEQKTQVDAAAERKAAVAEFQARCKKIDAHTAAIKNDAWRKAVEIVANKHKDGEANFEEFRTEANDAIAAVQAKSHTDIEDDPKRSQIEVVGERGKPGAPRMSVGEAFVKSPQYLAAAKRRAQGERVASMEFPGVTMLGARGKASLQQRAGWATADLSAVNITVMPGMIQLGVQELTIMDLLPGGALSTGALVYPRENGFGTLDGVALTAPRAKTVGEAGLKPNWDPDLTTETASVKKIAVTTKVPDEMMSDFPAMQSFIDARMPYMVDLETEFQILYGDGTGNNLKGIFTNTGVQTRAIVATDGTTIAESLKKGLTDIRVGSRFVPTGFAFHPYDWETASLLKDSEGRFLAGGPFYAPFGNGMFVEINTFWGKPVVVSDSVTYGQPVAGAWNMGAQYFMREGMRLETTNANEDDFRRNLICVRAEHRLALATYRPVAFLEFTGFPART